MDVTATTQAASTGSIGKSGGLNFEIRAPEHRGIDTGDSAQFRAALERHSNAGAGGGATPVEPGAKASLGEKMNARVANLASDVSKDQQHISKMLEQASRTGDSMQLMRAMMALNDYQVRVQTISKTVSKATGAFEQLTKLQ